MTGYGRGTAEQGGLRATVEVRAVNHRFLDVKVRGTALSAATEEAVSSRVRSTLDRGAIAISVHVARAPRNDAAEIRGLRIDPDAARRAYEVLAETALLLGIAGPDLTLIVAQPGVIVAGEDRGDEGPAVATALDAALRQLDEMRCAEGKALAAELEHRLGELVAHQTTLTNVASTVPHQLARRLQERLQRLLADTQLEPSRLAQEVAVLADRADITEELVRLVSHLDQARRLLAGQGAVGRRLDFLVQEIGRELNTIGSKSATTEISSVVVEAKATLEKVREQVQNVE